MQPIPDRLVVLTFDDGRRSDVELVGPLLARYGFGATFYVTEGLGFEDKSRFLDWDEIRWLHDAGFEIGNHHGRHVAVDTQTREEFERDLRHMEESCAAHGIPKPVTYCYPGGHHCRVAVDALHDAGYLFARRCTSPEHVDHADGAFGRAYAPGEDHPLLIPVAAIGGPAMDLDDLCAAVSTARDGRISVICLHGVPDDHTFCSTTPELFERFVDHLAGNDFTVIALRDLARYVDPWRRPADPYAPIRVRLCVHARELTCEHRAGPADVDGAHPRFHWVLASDQRGQRQSSYQVLVASRREQLQPGRADRWDSGKVESGEPDVAYAGRPLANGETCWWTVRCWDAGGRPGPWAAPERFETGLVDPADRTGERFRAGSEASPDPLLGIAVPDCGSRGAPAGFDEVRIKPRLPGQRTRAEGSIRTARGCIAVSWERTAEAFTLKVTLPAGVNGLVTVPTLGLPAFRIDEHGAPVWRHGSPRAPRPWQVDGVGAATADDAGVTFELSSGDYRFRVSRVEADE